MYHIAVSIVLYNTDKSEVLNLINKIKQSELNVQIFLIDNSKTDALSTLANGNDNVVYIFNNSNLGYGKAHNIAIKSPLNKADYHIVLNSDIDFDQKVLTIARNFMEENQDVTMLSPQILTPEGDIQFFCRKLPRPFDLFARRFIPPFIKRFMKADLDSYLLKDKDYSKIMNIPNLPGCFMFVRKSTLVSIGGFDENYFMYMEDIDLTRRLNEYGKTYYFPEIVIEHKLARGSYKFSKLFIYHISSAISYFNKWGWFNDDRRKAINTELNKY